MAGTQVHETGDPFGLVMSHRVLLPLKLWEGKGE